MSLKEIKKALPSRGDFRITSRNPLYANTIYLMINSLVTASLGFAFWIVAARFYSPENVGLASATISAIILLSTIAQMGLNLGVIRYLAESGKENNDIINSCYTLIGSVSLLSASAFLIGIKIWSPALSFLSQNSLFFAGFIFFTIMTAAFSFQNYVFVANRRAEYVAGQAFIYGILKLALVIVVAKYWGSFGMIGSAGIGAIIVVLISNLFFLPRVQTNYRFRITVKKDIIKKIFSFSISNYFSNLLWMTPALILPIMIVNLLSAEQNAYFYIVWAINVILMGIAGAASYSLFAEGSYNQGKLTQNTYRSVKMTLALLLPVIAILLVFGDKILLLFGQSYSQEGTRLLRLLAISALPASVIYVYISVKRVEKKLTWIIVPTALIAVVTLGLSYALIPIINLEGVGVAWLVANVTAAGGILGEWLWKRKGLQITTMNKN